MVNEEVQVSIIIPTYNRNELLLKSLHCIESLKFPGEKYEVIIINDGGEINNESLLNYLKENQQIQVFYQKNKGPGMARNYGAKKARGDFLAFLDDDCCPDPYWLTNLCQAISENEHAMIGGMVENALNSNLYSAASQSILSAIYLYQFLHKSTSVFFTTNNMLVSKEIFHQLNGFDPTFHFASEDRDLCKRWRKHGFPLIFKPNALVYHNHELTFSSFWKQQFSYGIGLRNFILKHNVMKGYRRKFKRVGYYWAILSHPFQKFNLPKACIIALLIIMAHIALLVGYTRAILFDK